jgi:hypothetical protein
MLSVYAIECVGAASAQEVFIKQYFLCESIFRHTSFAPYFIQVPSRLSHKSTHNTTVFSQTSTMPSPFQQKYSSQSHKVFGDSPVPDMPAGPKETADRRASDSSMSSASGSPDGRRRSSAAQRYANLHALKRPESEEHQARRASLQDSYGKVGVLGGLWNT